MNEDLQLKGGKLFSSILPNMTQKSSSIAFSPFALIILRLKSMSSNSVFSVACWTGSAEHEIHVRPLKTFQWGEPPGGTLVRVSITSVSLWLLTARCCQRRTYKFKSWPQKYFRGGCSLSVYLITCDGRRDGGGHRHADHKSLSCRWKWFIGSLRSLRPVVFQYLRYMQAVRAKRNQWLVTFFMAIQSPLCAASDLGL